MGTFARWAVVRLCALSFAIASTAVAQTIESPTENFKIEVSPQSNLTLKFANGNEAEISVYRSGYATWPMPMSMTENMCDTKLSKASCTMNMRAELQFLMLMWTKNSDSTRIGTPVTFNNNQLLESDILYESEDGGHRDTFICDDYRWLSGNANSDLNRNEVIVSWGSEGNVGNSETGLTENRTAGGAFDVMLTAAYGRMYQVSSSTDIVASITTPGFLAAGPVSMILTNKSTHELCQVQFSANIGKIQAIISKQIDGMFKLQPTKQLTEKNLRNVRAVLERYQFKKGDFK